MEKEMMLKRMAAFGDGKRFSIIHLLSDNGEMTIAQIRKSLNLEAEEVSSALTYLEEAEIVTSSKAGKNTSYAMNAKALLEMADFLDALCSPHIGGCSCGCCSH